MKLVIVESPTKAKTISKFLGKEYKVLASYGHIFDLPKKELGVDVDNNFKTSYIVSLRGKKTIAEIKKLAKEAEKVFIATDPDREGEAIGYHIAQYLDTKTLSKGSVNPKSKIRDQRAEIRNLKPESRDQKSEIRDQKSVRVVFHEITKEAVEEAFKNATTLNKDLVDSQTARRVLDRLVGYKLSPLLWKKVAYGLSAGRVQSVAVRMVVEREEARLAFKKDEYWSFDGEFRNQNALIGLNPLNPQSKSFIGFNPNQEIGSDPLNPENLNGVPTLIKAQLKKINDKEVKITNQKDADILVENLSKENYAISKIEKKPVKKSPYPPFTTSTLTQAGSNVFGYSAKKTMLLAQKLFEKGLITYHRTDSLNLSLSFIEMTRKFIEKEYGKEYLPAKGVFYKTKSKVAQEAHEAIRPTDVKVRVILNLIQDQIPDQATVGYPTWYSIRNDGGGAVRPYKKSEIKNQKSEIGDMEEDEKKLYDLIWKRAVSCQMMPAVYERVSIDIASSLQLKAYSSNKYLFRSSEQILIFPGYLKAYHATDDSKIYDLRFKNYDLGAIKEGTNLDLVNLTPTQHFTEPPPRYSTASLIKELEKEGIGRPSTYASIISTIEGRGYILRDGKYFYPSDTAFVVNNLLVAHFPEVVDFKFTAKMEDNLDNIANGKMAWVPVIKTFYEPFISDIETANTNLNKRDFTTLGKAEGQCPDCKSDLVFKLGRYGKFISCSKFPTCKYMKPIIELIGQKCPDCKDGDIIIRRTKKNKIFYGCTNYPKCKWASWKKPEVLIRV